MRREKTAVSSGTDALRPVFGLPTAGRTWQRLAVLAAVLLLARPAFAQHVIDTHAGGGPENVNALSAALSSPQSVAVDGSGNLYVAAQAAHRVFKVDTSGLLTVLAGNASPGFSGDGGPANQAALNSPSGVAVDGSGNVYIVDWANARLRRVDGATGIITTLVGNGVNGFMGDGGPASSAALGGPNGVAVDGSGNVYIADTGNNRIRRVDIAAGTISTIAGTGIGGFSGDGGLATAASLNAPLGVAVDGAGNVFIADTSNSRIRRVDALTGNIVSVAGNGGFGYGGDAGPATAATLYAPSGVALDSAGNIFIADQANRRVRRVNGATGIIDTVAGDGGLIFGGDGGPATSASLSYIKGLAVDASGQIFIADTGFHRVRKVDASGGIDTVVGNGWFAFGGDDGAATSAVLFVPQGVAVDAAGNVFVAEAGNHRIRRVDKATGLISTVAGGGNPGFSGDGGPATSAELNDPFGVAVDGAGNLYVADKDNNRIRRVSTAGTITTVAGNGGLGLSGDGGPATSAMLNRPTGVAVDGAGNLFIADFFNNRIRRVDAISGVITTAAGSGGLAGGFAGDGGPATSARLNTPTGVAVDPAGNLYIADRVNARIRKVDGAGIITTVAGDGTEAYAGDGGLATMASIARPVAVAVDEAGNLFITDTNGHNIRKVDAAGIISTVAGTGAAGFSGDGGPAPGAQLSNPWGVAVDGQGNVYIGDTNNQRVRRVANRAPLADAGPDQTVADGSAFTLDGGGSSDPDADDLVFEWWDETATPATLIGTSATVTQVLSGGPRTLRLIVNDGYQSASDTVTVGAAATYDLSLTVTSTENGSGGVDVQPFGAGCGVLPGGPPQACSTPFTAGTMVTLTALPTPDSIFAGWGGACSGTGPCTVAMTEHTAVTAEFLGPRVLALTVTSTENGSGGIAVQPSGGCGVLPGSPPQACTTPFTPGTMVTLTALPTPDSIFAGWGGACSGTGPCIVTMTQHAAVTAEFLGPRVLALTATSTENGSGGILVQPSGTGCGVLPGFPPQACTTPFTPGTMVTLTALPTPDSIFAGWGGACSGTGPCIVTMTQHTAVTAEFLGPRVLALTATSTENGSGGILVQPSGTGCGVLPGGPPQACTTPFTPGTIVTLTALPTPDSIFVGWSGACSGTGPCTVTMTQHTEVTAEFLGPRQLSLTVTGIEGGHGQVNDLGGSLFCAGPGMSSSQTCTQGYRPGTMVTLEPLALPDSVFVGWSGACSGIGPCTVTMTEHTVVTAEFLGPRQLSLTVTGIEGGHGQVNDVGGSLFCAGPGMSSSQTCTQGYRPGTMVTLEPLALPDSVFVGWSGACSGTGPCTVTMTEHTVVTAEFLGPRQLSLTVTGIAGGHGQVNDVGGSLFCAGPGMSSSQTCTQGYRPGTRVTLEPLALPDSIFAGWGGACSGTGPCTVAMTQHTVVTAVFTLAPGWTPIGSSVSVSPQDQNGASPVALVFETVSQGGITSLTTSTPPTGGPLPPQGFDLGDPPTYYELSTTAVRSGPIRICINYAGVQYLNEADLRLLHYENGAWVDVTVSLDTMADLICGETTSLSPFTVAQHARPVGIDIRPRKSPNVINLNSHGEIATAILSSASFDARRIDPSTVTLAGASVRSKRRGHVLAASIKDVNGDGRRDLVVHMNIQDLELSLGDTVAVLEGATFEGKLVRGTDSVKVVRKRCHRDDEDER